MPVQQPVQPNRQEIRAASKFDFANAAEEDATYHGRRHETTMYTNKRKKVRTMKNICNKDFKKKCQTKGSINA